MLLKHNGSIDDAFEEIQEHMSKLTYLDKVKLVTDPKTREALHELYKFGFSDFERNVQLCKEHNNDASEIAGILYS
jgi:hypothetical protein